MFVRTTLASLALLVAAAAPAATYVASLQAPVPAAQLVSSERLWSCAGMTCAAGGEASSPARHICARLVRATGALSGFSASGREFTADDLAACNAAGAARPR